MKTETNEVVINGVAYVPKGAEVSETKMATKLKGLKYCIVRTENAGVFAGYLKSRKENEAVVLKARRLWYWSGAASLSQLSVDGVSKPNECKFPCEVESVELLSVIEILDCTEKAQNSINLVPVWKM